MSWAVTGDVGKRGPAINLNVFEMAAQHSDENVLQHCEGIWTVFGGARPIQKFECFWKASCHPDEKLTQHRELSWTVFGGARPAVHLNVVESLHNIKTIPMFTAVKWAGPWQGMLGSAAQPSTWMFLKWLHNIQTKRFFNTVEGNWAVFGGARPNLKLECF